MVVIEKRAGGRVLAIIRGPICSTIYIKCFFMNLQNSLFIIHLPRVGTERILCNSSVRGHLLLVARQMLP